MSMVNYSDNGNDIFNPDQEELLLEGSRGELRPKENEPVLYRIYPGSRIAISSAVGKQWRKNYEAAVVAYDHVWSAWEDAFRYYNNDQNTIMTTPVGVFKRGDGSENIIYSNVNIMLPAVYSKDPQVTCSTTDEGDKAFCDALEPLINTLFRRKDALNAKPKVKKAVGIGLLTNFGVMKIDWTKRDDSRELAVREMEAASQKLAQAQDPDEVEAIYGQLQALELNMETRDPMGPSLKNLLPHNLIVDPYAEQPDGLDGNWMIEPVLLPTNMLIARFTQPGEGDTEGDNVLVYKPTHVVSLRKGQGEREDNIGLSLRELDGPVNFPTTHTTEERAAYLSMHFSQCFYVWDKITRRVMLFHRDDWTWPLWVWDDPLQISRFFPYYIISYSMSTGGTAGVGEVSYYMDHQDAINDINKQMAKMRRTVFDFWLYNTDAMGKDEAEKFIDALRGKPQANKKMLGISAGERKIQDCIESVIPPSAQVKELFDKTPIFDAVNRLTNTSDALRGVQFKTNTNVAAVDTYQESMRLMVGAKVDVVEDVVADVAQSLAEMCVQYYTQEEVAGIIGDAAAQGWREMGLAEFRSIYNVQLVAGSMEKPNSVFKKKEAVQISQAVGQFAQAAPGATLRVMLRVLEQAFTEVIIKPEDWEAIDAEIAATTQKGISTGAQPNGAQDVGAIAERLKALPPEVQQQAIQMKQSGSSPQEIKAFLMQHLQQGQPQPQNQPQPAA